MRALALHCGGEVKSREEVFGFPVPPATGSYTPIPHKLLLTELDERLAAEGLAPRAEKLAVTRMGQRLFGLKELSSPDAHDRTYGCVLGLRNSYDGSFAPGLCAGSMVFVCDNLGFYGSHLTFQIRQTANLIEALPSIIGEAVAALPAAFAAQSTAFSMYRQTRLNDRRAHDAVFRIHARGGLDAAEILGVLQEWQTPRHEEFAGPKTAWRLLNAATEIIKGDLWKLPDKTFVIHQVLEELCRTSTVKELQVGLCESANESANVCCCDLG